MRRISKILGIFLGILLIVILFGIGYILLTPVPTYEPGTVAFKLQSDSLAIARGKSHAQMVCNECHYANGKLEGKLMLGEGDPFGMVWAPNITQHPEKGIGKYADGELVYLLRTGIKNDGSFAPAWMPKFPLLSDSDMNDLIAYLRSDQPELKPSEVVQPDPQYSFLSKALLHTVMKPLPYNNEPILTPSSSDPVALGEYLATAKVDCFGCHSPDFKTQNYLVPDETPGFFSGGNPILYEGEINYSANLTPHDETGIGKWSEEAFIKALQTGIRPDGTVFMLPMKPYPQLSADEIAAIYAYLQSIPPIPNDVAAFKKQS